MKQNFLQGTRGTFTLAKLPDVLYYAQDYQIPSVTLPVIVSGTQFVALNEPGGHLQFEQFNISLLVDEKLTVYRDILEWMRSLAPPQDRYIYEDQPSRFSDGILTIFSNQQNPIARVQFYDMFPTTLGQIQFSALEDSSIVRTCNINFSYRDFEFFPV